MIFRPLVQRIYRLSLYQVSKFSIDNKIAFIFPGQGAQYVGMGEKLSQEFTHTLSIYNTASNILGYDLFEICTKGPKDKLDSTEIAQPAIFVSSVAALEMLKYENSDVYNSGLIKLSI